MTFYLVPLIILSIFALFEESNKFNNILTNKIFYYSIALFFIIFIGLRYEIGCDWERYVQMFDKFSSMSFIDLFTFNYVIGPHRDSSTHLLQEFGHVIITILSRNIYILNTVYASLFVVPLFFFCSKIKRVYLSLLISYPYYILVVGMGPIRQAACISLLMLSILFIQTRKYLSYFLSTTFSILIHQFSIIFNGLLLISIFPRINKNLLSKKI